MGQGDHGVISGKAQVYTLHGHKIKQDFTDDSQHSDRDLHQAPAVYVAGLPTTKVEIQYL
jgi:hypothetical protein